MILYSILLMVAVRLGSSCYFGGCAPISPCGPPACPTPPPFMPPPPPPPPQICTACIPPIPPPPPPPCPCPQCSCSCSSCSNGCGGNSYATPGCGRFLKHKKLRHRRHRKHHHNNRKYFD